MCNSLVLVNLTFISCSSNACHVFLLINLCKKRLNRAYALCESNSPLMEGAIFVFCQMQFAVFRFCTLSISSS